MDQLDSLGFGLKLSPEAMFGIHELQLTATLLDLETTFYEINSIQDPCWKNESHPQLK